MELGESSTSTAQQNKRKREHPFDGITPQANASSPTVMKKGPWDVFINHRGCDTKHKLASTIYHTLDLLRLHAFLDVEELQLGDSIPDEIQEAMRTAGIHIAIFSKNYAESPWCLAELSYMLKTGTPILPVFYHVDPTDLRWVAQEKGLYAPAFSEHKKKGRYPSSKLEEWETALERVSNLSGHVLNDHHGDEGMLLKSIVKFILKVIKKEPLEVAKHPVGMDEIVEDFEKSRQEDIEKDQQVQIVGIVGLGGSGKTTLATELYNRESSSFNSSSFLHDVRDAASKNALHTKQMKLLQDLRIQADPLDNVREGKRILSQNLPSLCALIVLDDVDHEDQLDALLPAKESLGSGSLVIVTTREGDVLAKWGITSTYKMQSLRRPLAKQLFCGHAFLKPSPQEGFEDLVENFIDVCHGLPLSLKVIGGQLYGKRSTAYWVSQLDKIRRILPKEVKERLKVSYDALDKEEQEVFLDIACFFIGERPSLAIAVWDGSGWSGLCSWETLHNKCLVEVVDHYGEKRIRMHDHLRDLGRDIAQTHSPSRIWSERQSMHFQQGMSIQGIISTRLDSWGRYIPPPLKENMEMMRISNVRIGLQVLIEGNDDLATECGEPRKGLLWFRGSAFQGEHRCIPSWLSLDNIRVLELICPSDLETELETLWDDAHPPLQLIELLIYRARKLPSLPRSIGHLKHLKRLSLTGSAFDIVKLPLSSLPEEFCRVQSLEHLDLEGCINLSSLPDRFGDLVNLRHISLAMCTNLKRLPVSFKHLRRLEYLCLDRCAELTLESDNLENITNLKVFNIPLCRKLQVLPHNITNQPSLRKLAFCCNTSLQELPASIGQLSKLEELVIEDCPLLTRLPTSLGNLSSMATLTMETCPKYDIPCLAGLVSLKSLRVIRCPEINKIEGLEGLVSLKSLRVIDCPEIKKIEGLEQLTSLEELDVWTCWMVPGLHSLEGMERLHTVKLKAESLSVFDACIQNIEIEKWPWKTRICGKVFPGAESILDSFTFPGLDVVDSFVHTVKRSRLTCPDTKLSNAAILCFLVRSEGGAFVFSEPFENHPLSLSEGEWIVIRVFREVAPLNIEDRWRFLSFTGLEAFGGWLIVGERSSIVEGFKQLFQTLCAVNSVR